MPIISVNVPDELYARLQKLATDMEYTVEECHVWALEDFIAEDRPAMDALLEGIRDADEGRLIAHEEVMEWATSLLTPTPIPMPAAKSLLHKLAS